MKGTGVGATYDTNRDVLWLLADARHDRDAGREGGGALEATPATAGLARAEHYIKLVAVRAHRGRGTGTAMPTTSRPPDATDDQSPRRMELRGNSRITGTGAARRSAMTAQRHRPDLRRRRPDAAAVAS